MSSYSLKGIQIKGISTSVPDQIVSNFNYDLLSDSEKKMLVKTIGVETRRVVTPGVTTSDLAIHAANKLFNKIGWERGSVDLLVFVTQSRDYYLPSIGVISQNKLGLPTSCMAFDIGLGCSGYVYGLSVVSSLLSSSKWKRAILLAGDVSTISCSYNDKSTYPLFGDAGSATFIENTGEENEWSFDLNSDGSGEDAIKITHGCLKNIPDETSFIEKERGPGIKRADMHLALDGLEVFNFSISTVPKSIRSFLESKQTSINEMDYFVMHQANLLMNETIRKKVNAEKEQTPYSIQQYGNTSSASIPLTIVSELGDLKERKSRLLLSGFGVGLSWANAILENDKIPYLLLNEYTS